MTRSAIIAKLDVLLAKGITNEAEALYLIVEVRKLLEQQQAKRQFEYLTFHCDWAVHATLKGTTAQRILKLFDEANLHLKSGIKLENLPSQLREEVEGISMMQYFEAELNGFLAANGLSLIKSRSEAWTHFLHLYARIVEDCPLVMTANNGSAGITAVTLKMVLANAPTQDHMFFKVSWIIQDKNGMTGEIYGINSFRMTPAL
jgi:hypothetical protein